MKKEFLSKMIILILLSLPVLGISQDVLDLKGKWLFKLDAQNKGVQEEWYLHDFQDEVRLPGCLQEQGFGNDVTIDTKWYGGSNNRLWATHPIYEKFRQPDNIKILSFLQPKKQFVGAAWYKKKVVIPANWNNKRIILYLERAHWETTLWINGQKIGSQNFLGVEHQYDLTGILRQGENSIVLKIDNSQIINLGRRPHSVSDETQTAWNGVIGAIKLLTTEKIWIDDVQVYPDLTNKKVRISYTVCRKENHTLDADVLFQVNGKNFSSNLPVRQAKVRLESDTNYFSFDYSMGDGFKLWEEFTPNLYKLSVSLKPKATGKNIVSNVQFGMREIKVNGTMFQLNGNNISIRGNLDCAIYPLNGYPYMDKVWWVALWKKYKEWGFNLARFHSWCPPRAAFDAADEVGIFMQPEVSEWTGVNTPEQEAWFTKESAEMLKQYGNSPSFILMELGNEAGAATDIMKRLIAGWKKDSRRLYSGKPNGNPKLSDYDFAVECWLDTIRTRYQYGWPPLPEGAWYNTLPPQTTVDFSEAVLKEGRPLISHEVGQRCVYPNVIKEIPKYTGLMRPTYLEIGKDQLTERGMIDQVEEFTKASGMWQVQLYKEEIESHLRTPNYAGFHLLSLQDFPGQGSAPVGVVDAFYDTRGYVTANDFRKFCNDVVVLAKIKKRILNLSDTLQAGIDIYNYSASDVNVSGVTWKILDKNGKVVIQKKLPGKNFANASLSTAGEIRFPIGNLKAAEKYKLKISIDNTVIDNEWEFWVFPDKLESLKHDNLIIANKIDDEVFKQLNDGKTVVVFANPDDARGGLPTCFTGFYWSTFGMSGGESSALGLVCKPSHPVFADFPTDAFTNWQWWDILTHTRPMILDEFQSTAPFPKNYKPLVQLIDSWLINRKLGALIEGRIGSGKIIISSMDLTTDLDNRPAARQMRQSILKYAASEKFSPSTALSKEMLENLFLNATDNKLKAMGATVKSSSQSGSNPASALIDGKVSTFWQSASSRTGQFPYSIVIDLKETQAIKGLKYIPRQSELTGKVAKYTIYTGNDTLSWNQSISSREMKAGDGVVKIIFPSEEKCRYIKFEIQSSQDGTAVSSVAELDILKEDD